MSVQLFFLDKVLRVAVKRRFRKRADVMELRAIMQQMPIRPAPRRIIVDTISLNGIAAERLRIASADDTRALLYIHGGGFVAGVPANHRPLTWRLAEKLGVPVFAIDYRLAPEHPFPAALEDCVAAYRALLESGLSPSAIVIAGDSAGGNLTLATALKLKALDLPQPAALVCLSPATDWDETPSRLTNVRADALFVPAMFATVPAAYCPGCDTSDPLISPLRGDLAGLPPTLIQCSGAEMLRDDGVFMAEKLNAAGVAATLEVWPGVFHVWHLMADILPEGRRAIDAVVKFIQSNWRDRRAGEK
jgi:epsilon-lactone hydrolase